MLSKSWQTKLSHNVVIIKTRPPLSPLWHDLTPTGNSVGLWIVGGDVGGNQTERHNTADNRLISFFEGGGEGKGDRHKLT